MTGIIVTGHGNFATGLLSSMKLIAGEQEKVIPVDFNINDTIESLEKNLKHAILELNDEILVLCDLAGGSPFKVAALLSQELKYKKIKVLAGTNLGMLIETALSRGGNSVEELTACAITSGQAAIKAFEIKERSIEVEEEDGI